RLRVMDCEEGIRQLVQELVWVETKLLHRPRHHRLQEGCSRHVIVRFQPSLEPASDALCLWHAAHARRQVENSLALRDRELPEQDARVARLGGDPARATAT